MINVRVARKVDPRTLPAVMEALGAAEAALAGTGRVVLRASGTEPLIRVMVEGQDAGQVQAAADGLAAVVRAAAG
jgi:phosphoglucosamine mutase